MIKAILFGLDGTLLDTAPDLVATLNQMRADKGFHSIPVEDLRHFVARGVSGLIKAGMPPCDDETLARWRHDFMQRSSANRHKLIRPFDEVESLLSGLGDAGVPWGIVTNKTGSLCQPLLECAGYLSTASVVICGDTVGQEKPRPEPVLAACESLGFDPQQVLMVGDDMRDIEAGRRAGCQTAFARYGYGARESLSDLTDETMLIDSPVDLLNLFSSAAEA